MPTLQSTQAEPLQDIALRYVQGEPLEVIAVRLQAESSKLKLSCKELYKSLSVKNFNNPYIIAFLKSLNIKKSPTGEVGEFETFITNSASFYDLLVNLNYAGYHHVECLLKLIDKAHPPRNTALLFSLVSLFSAGLVTLFHFKKDFFVTLLEWGLSGIHWLGRTFSILKNIPLLGMLYNSLDLLSSWIVMAFKKTQPARQRVYDLLFKTVQSALTITAYGLMFLAGGTLAFPIAILFILSAATDVLKSLFILYKNYRDLNNITKPEDDASWESIAEYERAKNLLQSTVRSVWLKLGIAMLITAAVIVWCLSPPSLILSVVCCAFICLLTLSSISFSNVIKHSYAQKLQESIANIKPSNDPELYPSTQRGFNNHAVEFNHHQAELERREEILAHREQELNQKALVLDAREHAITDTLAALSLQKHSFFSGTAANSAHALDPHPNTPSLPALGAASE
ncbi:hypothetical protein [Legionella yabuuchiae]|uniref:hypothetical protein n=1 Tax=Legionella yabuuchiae TaxID=376727 RepID=UPI001054548C|nr:hypothetical protein [Legionella yabuuchiae]